MPPIPSSHLRDELGDESRELADGGGTADGERGLVPAGCERGHAHLDRRLPEGSGTSSGLGSRGGPPVSRISPVAAGRRQGPRLDGRGTCSCSSAPGRS